LAPKKTLEQTNVQFLLSVCRWYEPHKRSNDEIDQVVDSARRSGRVCLYYALSDDALTNHHFYAFLLKQGFAELTNVYLFTAPLDALNWKVMQAPKFQDVTWSKWTAVARLNDAAKDIHCRFLDEYVHVKKSNPIEDPFPTADMNEVSEEICLFNRVSPEIECNE